MVDVEERPGLPDAGLSHRALLYAGDDEFVEANVPFLREGVAAREPTFVLVEEPKIALLKDALGDDAAAVTFADVRAVGGNPARLIPVWAEFAHTHHAARRVRGIGEPIWFGRTEPELVECRLHEALINVAFRGDQAVDIVCPYDVSRLDAPVIEGVHQTHPVVGTHGRDAPSAMYAGDHATRIFGEPLPRPSSEPETMHFSTGPLHDFRNFVRQRARAAGLEPSRVGDLVLAANEIASNSVLHGGGSGLARIWIEDRTILCEVRDGGHIGDVLVGRRRPTQDEVHGRGVWMANQLCDLVQMRSSERGTVVRLHMRVE